MTKKLLAFLALTPILIFANPHSESLDAYVEDLMKEHNIPGVAVGIIQNGQISHLKGYGYRDKEAGLSVNPDTQFSIGSLSKAFTSLAVLMAAESSLLSLELPIKQQVSSFQLSDKTATENATLIDLLSHQSGQARHDLMWLGSRASRSTLVERLPFLATHLSYKQKYYYNNLMIMAVGDVIEKRSGRSWEDWINNDILGPLNMARSNTSTREFKSNYAHPYWYKSGKLVKRNIRVTDNMGPAASVNSTARDMLKWGQFALTGLSLEGKKLVSKESHTLWQSPQVEITDTTHHSNFDRSDYALGWRVSKYRNQKLIRHGGSIGSYLSNLVLLPELNAAIVVLQNADHSAITSLIAYRAADDLMGLEPDTQRKPSDFEWEDADEHRIPQFHSSRLKSNVTAGRNFEGVYTNPGYGSLVVSQDRKIVLSYNDWTAPLIDKGQGKLSSDGNYFTSARYATNSEGQVESLSIPLEPQVPAIVFTKNPSEPISRHPRGFHSHSETQF